jgi:DNA-binding Lrp family transcriptional regulator
MAGRIDDFDCRLLARLQAGLPLVARPYAALARELGTTEEHVRDRLRGLQADGTVSRFGVVVRHHELGYRANAMVVWDIPDDDVSRVGAKLAGLPYVTLCYRRPRRMPRWPYNLFCMIHGRCREEVLGQVRLASEAAGIAGRDRAVLFSKRRFKQRGARYDTMAGSTARRGAA